MSIQEEISQLRQDALAAFAAAQGDRAALEAARIKFLGTKGLFPKLMQSLRDVPADQKPAVGKLLNETKVELTAAFEQAGASAAPAAPSGPVLDVSEPLPPEQRRELGRRHPLTRTVHLVRDLFRPLGFEVVSGPEVEDERHNFDDLNIPPDHPSRDGFDSFFLQGRKRLLRSHTSPVQVRVMETHKPPIRAIVPGRVYRPDRIDATHASTFHQIEGLYVDRGVSMADLKGTLQLFVEGLFGAGTRIRFRPSFFPFTEPSAELDCSCPACGGPGCPVCKQAGWLELGGCGMVDPNVFRAINRTRGDEAYDPEIWSGFAFGFGVERLCMRRHGIDDLRLFLENDLRFLRSV